MRSIVIKQNKIQMSENTAWYNLATATTAKKRCYAVTLTRNTITKSVNFFAQNTCNDDIMARWQHMTACWGLRSVHFVQNKESIVIERNNDCWCLE